MTLYPGGGTSPGADLAALEKRVRALEAGLGLGNSAVRGTLQAIDPEDVVRARFGDLGAGLWGFSGNVHGAIIRGGEVRTPNLILEDDLGNPIPLSQLFGVKAGTTASLITPARNAWLNDNTLGQTVTVAYGRLLITVSGKLEVTLGRGDLSMGFHVTRVSDGATVVAPSRDVALRSDWDGSAGMGSLIQASYRAVVTGLPAGEYLVRPAYYTGAIGTPTARGDVSQRSIIVEPF